MTIAPSMLMCLGMGSGLGCALRMLNTFQKHPLLETGKMRGIHWDMGQFCIRAGRVCTWPMFVLRQQTQKLSLLVSKGSAACHSVLGASGLKKNVT